MGLLYSNYESQNNSITNNNTKINAVSGTLTKTYQKSYFIKDGNEMYDLYTNEPYRKMLVGKDEWHNNYSGEYDSTSAPDKNYTRYYKHIPIIILQIMLAGENQKLYEIIDKEDYDKMFEIKEGKNEDN